MDTSVALVAVARPEDLTWSVRAAIEHGPIFLSVLSFWEVVLKAMKGKIENVNPREWWNEALRAFSAEAMVLKPEHVRAIADLPPIHHDPFDRALIAQATVEDLAFITSDRIIPQYASDRFAVVV